MKAIEIRIDHMKNPIGIDSRRPLVTWNCQGGKKQTAYLLEARCGEKVVYSSGKVSTSRMQARLDYSAPSRTRISVDLTLWDEMDIPGETVQAYYETGILDSSEFKASWINPEPECDPNIHKPASYLKKDFLVEKTGSSRLYITCHGLYVAYLNGKRVGDFVLAPGSYNYDKRIAYQTYDVTSLIQKGKNQLAVVLGDGWYRSVSGVDGDRNLYGEDVALFCQLEVGGEIVCMSDETWQASQKGKIRENDMQQGEVVDLRITEAYDYHSVSLADFSVDTLFCSNTVPIREKEHLEGRLIRTPNGQTVVDFGQNLAGYIQVDLQAEEGQTLKLTTGETLDENGNFTQENFQDRKRHKEGGTKQMLTLTCRQGANSYKPSFTIWGFRYALVETDIDLSQAAFTAIAVYSDMEEQLSFRSSNGDLDKLVQNALWSMKSNFCDVPTDCPTRERAAWTGDMGVFIDTGLSMMDCYTVVRKWLGECRLTQYPEGKLANISPRNNKPSFFSGLLAGSVGWGDASILVPYAMYQRFGDKEILEENYPMMKSWYAFLETRARSKPLNPIKRFKHFPNRDYAIETGIDYGEWCEPDVESQNAMRTPQSKVATAYFARSGQLLSEIAAILGKEEESSYYREVSGKARDAYRYLATEEGRIHSDRQAEYIRAITFDLLSEEEKVHAAEDLNQLVVKCGYHLNTGFLSTPDLCRVLADYGYVDTAFRVLLQEDMPGWIYAVKKGATTIWEVWNGIDEKGIPHESLNHYSKGAVVQWLIDGVCGLQIHGEKVVIKPHPGRLLPFAEVTCQTPLGKIAAGYRYDGEALILCVNIPSNVEASLVCPDGREIRLESGCHEVPCY